jgi:CHAT domain-containing protein
VRATAADAAASAEREPIEIKDHKVEEALRSGEHSGLLEDYFGAPQYAELRRLAREAAARGVRGGDRVLILPGIMGSKLGFASSVSSLFDDVIWIDPVDIARGRLSELKLNGGKPGIQALGVILFAYLKLKLTLQIAGHDAAFFPFDWRLDIVEIGKRLATQIKAEGREVHLVAHSMGGLVARAALLEKLGKSLGRIIMLGTPNFGSFSPLQAFRGTHDLASKVAFIDMKQSKEDLAGIYTGFPGLCQMIPSPDKVSSDFYDLQSWPKTGVLPDQAILKNALKVQRLLPTEYDRLYLIAGVNQDTVVDAKIENDEFVYTQSNAGDGTVPLACALLPAAKTYYVAESHGSLPNNGDVARAVDSILATGKTAALPDKYEPPRGLATRQVKERDIEVRPFGGTRGRALSAREKRLLLEAVAAPDQTVQVGAPIEVVAPATAAGAETAIANSIVIGRRRQHRLDVTLAYGSITEVETDAYVFGMFKLVPPGGAARAVDQLLGGAIDQMVSRRMFNANVGEISIMPTGKHPVRADVIAFAGLGTFDTFKEDILEIIGENLVRTFINTRIDEFATVPIGGATNAFTAEALRLLLKGFVRGLLDADSDHHFRGITICETNRERFLQIQSEFYRLCGTSLFDGVEVTLREVELPQPAPAAGTRAAAPAAPQNTYLLVRQETETAAEITYSCSVMTAGSKATIYKGRKPVDRRKLDDQLAQLASSRGVGYAGLPKFGSDLAQLIFSADINQILQRHNQDPIVVVHDARSSRIPWETLQFGGKSPALEGGLTHRYEAEDLSIAKWLEQRQQGPTLDVLLIVNPTGDLDGAEAEGERIKSLFDGLKPAVSVRQIRGGEARKNEIMKCLKSDQFDVIHYAGHAFFDPRAPSKSGILCAGKDVLSGADLATMGTLPSLVFFNACESGRLRYRQSVRTEAERKAAEKRTTRRVQEAVSFAEAFLRGGIANYVGTYWPVGDASALAFGETFYKNILAGATIGDAVMAGRKKVHEDKSVDWADYILYGDSGFVLKKAR